MFLRALFALPMTPEAAAIYRKYTGRTVLPSRPAREAWLMVGRRGGKSRVAALDAVYLACFRDYRAYLAPGEMGTLAVIAADRSQARTVMRYITGFVDAVPMLKAMEVGRTKETIEFSNRVMIEVHSASFRTIRGYTLVGAVCDEIAFWQTDDGSANPDTEILNGLRPGMATIPGAMLIAISSPYARRGALWDAYRRHYGRDDDPILVWQAPTVAMNPAVDPDVIAKAYEEDEAAAAAEYGAEFRRDIESFVSREAVDAVVVSGRRELPPIAGISYRAFVDPSGGSQDSMALAIVHREESGVVLDCVRERRAPFNPSDVVDEFVATLAAYGCERVTGDRYGGEWPREHFRSRGIWYETAEQSKSDYYLSLLPMINACQVQILDHPRLIAQLCSLERRTARGGRDTVDHPPGGRDDVVNAAAGALVSVARSPSVRVVQYDPELTDTRSAYQRQLEHAVPHLFEPPPSETCGTCWQFSKDGPLKRFGTGWCNYQQINVAPDCIQCEMWDHALE